MTQYIRGRLEGTKITCVDHMRPSLPAVKVQGQGQRPVACSQEVESLIWSPEVGLRWQLLINEPLCAWYSQVADGSHDRIICRPLEGSKEACIKMLEIVGSLTALLSSKQKGDPRGVRVLRCFDAFLLLRCCFRGGENALIYLCSCLDLLSSWRAF